MRAPLERPPSELYLHSNHPKHGTVTDISDSNTYKKMGSLNLLELSNISSNITTIIFTGHSSEGIRHSAISVSDMHPEALAEELEEKYHGQVKLNLVHFYFVSCEAGLNQPSFAEKFAIKMYGLGFLNVQVHAITPPKGAFGMRVQPSVDRVNGLYAIDAWYYASKQDDEQDESILGQLAQIDFEIVEQQRLSGILHLVDGKQVALSTTAQSKITSEAEQQIILQKIRKRRALETSAQLRKYICIRVNVKKVMQKPENTCGGCSLSLLAQQQINAQLLVETEENRSPFIKAIMNIFRFYPLELAEEALRNITAQVTALKRRKPSTALLQIWTADLTLITTRAAIQLEEAMTARQNEGFLAVVGRFLGLSEDKVAGAANRCVCTAMVLAQEKKELLNLVAEQEQKPLSRSNTAGPGFFRSVFSPSEVTVGSISNKARPAPSNEGEGKPPVGRAVPFK